jgi:hypothetical protein
MGQYARHAFYGKRELHVFERAFVTRGHHLPDEFLPALRIVASVLEYVPREPGGIALPARCIKQGYGVFREIE